MNILQLYLLTLIDPIHKIAIAIALGSGITLFFLLLFALADSRGAERKILDKWGKKILALFIVSVTLVVVIPSNSRLAVILGGYVVTNAETVDELPDNLARAANTFLKQYIEDENDR